MIAAGLGEMADIDAVIEVSRQEARVGFGACLASGN